LVELREVHRYTNWTHFGQIKDAFMSEQRKQPWWVPVPTDANWLARIRSDYPDHAEDSDDELREHFAHGRKYAVLWDHVGDAYADFQPLADAFFEQWARIAELETLLRWARPFAPNDGLIRDRIDAALELKP
jgi:hypothetical protein